MRKAFVLIAALIVLFGCACSLPQETTNVTDQSTNSTTRVTEIKFDYPDQLKYVDGGTASMTIFKCGAIYYACVDGNHSWGNLSSLPAIDLEDAEFIHVEADYDLAYGGIAGFHGNMALRKIRDERILTLDEVVDCRMIELYDSTEGTFSGLRLIRKNDNNYMICRDPMGQYRLYDDGRNLLCTCDTSMEAAGYLDEGSGNPITYGRSANFPYLIIRIGEIYYAYSRFEETRTWIPLINMEFENKPVGFELEDGQAMKVSSTRVYIVNGGEAHFINTPMFEKMDHYDRINYDQVIGDSAGIQWEQASVYENGKLYQYSSSLDTYLIFYIEDKFYVYHENGSGMETEELVGICAEPEEVNAAIGQ